jgi:MFS family permease
VVAQQHNIYLNIFTFHRFSSGSFVSLAPAPLMAMGGPHDVGRRVGMAFTVFAIGALVGPPVSGAINSTTMGYKDVGCYAGKFSRRLSPRFSLSAFVLVHRQLRDGWRLAHDDFTILNAWKAMGKVLKAW